MGLTDGEVSNLVFGEVVYVGYIFLLSMLLYLFYLWMQGPQVTIKKRLVGKTAVITGANSGIGKETALDLCRRGGKVVILCRSQERGQAAVEDIKLATNGDISMVRLDLASLQSVRQCAQLLNKSLDKIDILVNNAGVGLCPKSKTEDGFEMQIGVNHFGHFLLTNLLLPLLRKAGPGARIVTVSSMAHSDGKIHWDDLNLEKSEYDPVAAYSQSKLANILFSKELGRQLKSEGINTYVLHPGVVNTEIFRYVGETYNGFVSMILNFITIFMKTPEAGSRTTRFCALDESLENKTGLYYSDCAEKSPSSAALNAEDAKRLWEISQKAVGMMK